MVRVLLIDDDAAMREVLRTILEREHYEVLEAPDGEVGTQLFRAQLPDVVLTEILLPKKDGIETIRDLRKEWPHVKIIAMSGGGYRVTPQSVLEAAADFGALRTLAKPFSCQTLLSAVAIVLTTSV
ncbi:MAG: response regulator [Deltaproteobacteria bacterium]|nr:response regulator [Deltaproteobacteria bacterium]